MSTLEFLIGMLCGAGGMWAYLNIVSMKQYVRRLERSRSSVAEFSHVLTQQSQSDVVPIQTSAPTLSQTPIQTSAPTSAVPEVIQPAEMDELFNAVMQTPEELSKKAQDCGKEPVRFHYGKGYATNAELQQVTDKHEEFKAKKLSRAEEMELLNLFRHIENQDYHVALAAVEAKGHTLHPLYVEYGCKRPLTAYDGKVFGVRIKDPAFDYKENKPSARATIMELIDVGGQDLHGRGE